MYGEGERKRAVKVLIRPPTPPRSKQLRTVVQKTKLGLNFTANKAIICSKTKENNVSHRE